MTTTSNKDFTQKSFYEFVLSQHLSTEADNYCEERINLINAANVKAAEKRNEKKAAKSSEDAKMAELIVKVLTDEFQSATAINEAAGLENVTDAKVRVILKGLVAEGTVTKGVMDSKKHIGYKLADAN